jgi:hypothetical protein
VLRFCIHSFYQLQRRSNTPELWLRLRRAVIFASRPQRFSRSECGRVFCGYSLGVFAAGREDWWAMQAGP